MRVPMPMRAHDAPRLEDSVEASVQDNVDVSPLLPQFSRTRGCDLRPLSGAPEAALAGRSQARQGLRSQAALRRARGCALSVVLTPTRIEEPAVVLTPTRIHNSAAVVLTPTRIDNEPAVVLTPTRIHNSPAVVLTPTRIDNSAAVVLTSTRIEEPPAATTHTAATT